MLNLQGPLLPVWRDPFDNGGRPTAVRVRSVHEAAVGGGCCGEVLRQTHHERTAAQHQVGTFPGAAPVLRSQEGGGGRAKEAGASTGAPGR